MGNIPLPNWDAHPSMVAANLPPMIGRLTRQDEAS
jgi:hypothetical protein